MNRRGNQRGIALAWTIMVLLVMVGIVGLSLDWGKLVWNVHQMQNAGDAAALAGAHVVKFNWRDPNDPKGARQRAIKLAGLNIADQNYVDLDLNDDNDPNGELVLGRWIRQEQRFVATMDAPNAVLVSVRRWGQRATTPTHKLIFGPIFGTNEVPSSRDAIAWSVGSSGSGIICLATHPERYQYMTSEPNYPGYGSGPKPWTSEVGGGLVRDGGCEIDLRGPDGWIGDITVDSDTVDWPKEAAVMDGTSGKIWAGEVNVTGHTNPLPADWDVYYGDPDVPFSVNQEAIPLPDPLASINATPPDIATMSVRTCPSVAGGVTATIDPGWYPAGINPEGGKIIMNAGTYAVGGGTKASQVTGLVFNGGELVGNGVTIFITGDWANGIYWGKVNIGANPKVTLVSPGDAADPKAIDGLPGVVLWQDIRNHSEATIIGSSASKFIGVMYFPDAPVQLGGGTTDVGCQVIAGALHLRGNVGLNVAYDGRNMIKTMKSVLVR